MGPDGFCSKAHQISARLAGSLGPGRPSASWTCLPPEAAPATPDGDVHFGSVDVVCEFDDALNEAVLDQLDLWVSMWVVFEQRLQLSYLVSVWVNGVDVSWTGAWHQSVRPPHVETPDVLEIGSFANITFLPALDMGAGQAFLY